MFNWKRSPNPLTADSDDDEPAEDPYTAPVINVDDDFDGSLPADAGSPRALAKGGAKSVPDWLKAPPGKDAAPAAAKGTSLFENADDGADEEADVAAAPSPVDELPRELPDLAEADAVAQEPEGLEDALAALDGSDDGGADEAAAGLGLDLTAEEPEAPVAAEAADGALAEEVEALRARFQETQIAFHTRVTEEMDHLKDTFHATLDDMAERVRGLEGEVEAWERKVVEKDTEIARLKTALKGLISQASSLVESEQPEENGEED